MLIAPVPGHCIFVTTGKDFKMIQSFTSILCIHKTIKAINITMNLLHKNVQEQNGHTYVIYYDYQMSLVLRKPVFGVSDQVPHKPGCTVTEDGQRLEISDL